MKKSSIICLNLIILFILSSCAPAIKDEGENYNVPTYKPLIIAHRGASEIEPEHTFLSYDRAEKDGADYIEIDLRQTEDGELVAIHDEDVDRITDGTGRVENLTLDELRQLHVKKKQKILTLQEIVDHYGDSIHYYIETRTDSEGNIGMEEELVSILNSKDLIEKKKVIIESFSEESMITIHELNKDIPFVRLLRKAEVQELDDDTMQHIKNYAIGVGIYAGSVDADLVRKIHDYNLQLHVYYYDDEKNLTDKMLDLRVDGIFTNNPDYAISEVGSLN
ncbi:glycerophosphodiester phosphodiesterase family protein [Terribacillus saccharophilus]|uniref:glycerophosphodiester phosphodiesterase family protein n=2 Tax=Terribacillus saccharophilus TaxID=361277 RepID=UPI000BA52404|nr:glycerophosphodiester phosphodiesterase family protein [Terribacillus saccharophilus]PAF16624.1 hypothetical protein CHH51_16865 [Terribacillus saccharophilus]